MDVETRSAGICPSCGALVVSLEVVSNGITTNRLTAHSSPLEDKVERCKYDRGPYLGGHAREPFPGDFSH